MNSTTGSAKDYSFGPQFRIKHREDFLRIQREGRKFRSRHFLLILADPLDRGVRPLAHSRLGVTVTTKVHKRAVRRNRLKRLARELFRRERAKFQQPVDMVVIAMQDANELSFIRAVKELKYLYYQSGVLAQKTGRRAR